MATTTRTGGRERVDSLDGLRGILAISVMVFHLAIFEWKTSFDTVGPYAVYTFFILSGFAMSWVMSQKPPDAFPVRSFYVARGARIFPMWWVAVILTLIVNLPARPELHAVVENMTLLSALTPTSDIPIGGWSIEIEVVFYLLFPLLVSLLRTPRALAISVVAAAALRWIYVDAAFPPKATAPNEATYFQIPTFLVFFLAGMLIAELRRDRSPLRGQWPFLAAVGAFGAVFAASVFSPRSVLVGWGGLVLGAVCVGGVALAAFSPNPRSASTRRLLETLGAISFSTYLLHPIVYAVVHRAGLGKVPTAVATVVVTVVGAWFSYRWFEAPVRDWIRRRLSRQRSVA